MQDSLTCKEKVPLSTQVLFDVGLTPFTDQYKLHYKTWPSIWAFLKGLMLSLSFA